VAKRKRNYYKWLFYILLCLCIAYLAAQGRKKEEAESEYVNLRLAKRLCPATIMMGSSMIVMDANGTVHNGDEWYKKNRRVAKRRR